jgi:hypothetical protein
MHTVEDILDDLSDLKSALYECQEAGNVDLNTCDQAQELLREVRDLLEGLEN